MEIASTEHLTEPLVTTITFESKIINLQFNELTDLYTDTFEPSYDVPKFECKAGIRKHPSFEDQLITIKSLRGRKGKSMVVKNYMRSQISAFIRPSVQYRQYIGYYYKPKIFRTGIIELQGISRENLEDAKHALGRLANHFGKELGDITPKMINYKFKIKIGYGKCINLTKLKFIFEREQNVLKSKFGVTIYYSTYNREKVALNIKFDDIEDHSHMKKPKTILMKVFGKGKINFQGPYKKDITLGAFLSLDYITAKYGNEFINDIPEIQYDKILPLSKINIIDNIYHGDQEEK